MRFDQIWLLVFEQQQTDTHSVKHWILIEMLFYSACEEKADGKTNLYGALAKYLVYHAQIEKLLKKSVHWTHHTEMNSSTAGWLQPLCTDWRRPPTCRTDTRRRWSHRHTGRRRRLRTTVPETQYDDRAWRRQTSESYSEHWPPSWPGSPHLCRGRHPHQDDSLRGSGCHLWPKMTNCFTIKLKFCPFLFYLLYLSYPPAVAEVSLWETDATAGHSEVILVVVVEVSTKAAGVALIWAWHTHLQMWTTTPLNLKQVDKQMYKCICKYRKR